VIYDLIKYKYETISVLVHGSSSLRGMETSKNDTITMFGITLPMNFNLYKTDVNVQNMTKVLNALLFHTTDNVYLYTCDIGTQDCLKYICHQAAEPYASDILLSTDLTTVKSKGGNLSVEWGSSTGYLHSQSPNYSYHVSHLTDIIYKNVEFFDKISLGQNNTQINPSVSANDVTYTIDDTTMTIQGITMPSYIPDKIEYVNAPNIKRIAPGFFSGNHTLKGVVLNSLIEVSETLFYDCENLQSVIVPKIGAIGKMAFSKCKNINQLTTENVTYLMGHCFEDSVINCELNFSKLTEISCYSFKNCSIPSLFFPRVKLVGSYGFFGCDVPKITLDALINTKPNMFHKLTNVKKIYMNSVLHISPYCITDSTMPEILKVRICETISENAFNNVNIPESGCSIFIDLLNKLNDGIISPIPEKGRFIILSNKYFKDTKYYSRPVSDKGVLVKQFIVLYKSVDQQIAEIHHDDKFMDADEYANRKLSITNKMDAVWVKMYALYELQRAEYVDEVLVQMLIYQGFINRTSGIIMIEIEELKSQMATAPEPVV